MKTPCNILATCLAAALRFAATAAVPVSWTNAPGMPPFAPPPVPHGSTVDFAVTLKGYTAPPIAPGADVRLWYQTNGMGRAWWSAPAAFDGSTVTASFGPEQDCGADRFSLFFGAPSNVYASAVLRLTHSPGFAPSSLPLPVPVLDFAAVELRNLAALTNGWEFGGSADLAPATNYTDAALSAFSATGAVLRAERYGTPTLWTDATGCVWEVVDYGENWKETYNSVGVRFMEPPVWRTNQDGQVAGWYAYGLGHGYQLASTDIDAVQTPKQVYIGGVDDGHGDIVPYRGEVSWSRTHTNLVGRVALTDDMAAALSSFAATGTVYHAIVADGATDAYFAQKADDANQAYVSSYLYANVPGNFITGDELLDRIDAAGMPPWHCETNSAAQAVSYQTNGFAVVRQPSGLAPDMSQWPDGAAMFVRVEDVPAAYDVSPLLRLVGYGLWPTNGFQSVWWRSGTNVFVNILLEEQP